MKQKLMDIIFLTIITMAVFAVIIKMDHKSTFSEKENKSLAVFPDVNPFHETFPKKMDNYINDRIGFRKETLGMSSLFFNDIKRKILTTNTKGFIGQDNWLYINELDDSVTNFLRTVKYTENQLERMKNNLIEINDFCKKNNIKFYFIIGPNKSNIYPEYYIPNLNRLPRRSLYELFLDYIKDDELPLVDLQEPMLQKKKEGFLLYYKNDTHWNQRGAYTAYYELIQAIKKDFPDITYYKPEDLEYSTTPNTVRGDLPSMVGGYEYKYEPITEPFPKIKAEINILNQAEVGHAPGLYDSITTTMNTKGPKAYIVHDSFYEGMKPFLYKGFSKIVNRWAWSTSPLKFKNDILEKKPDILIFIMQERFLSSLMDFPPQSKTLP